MNEFERVILFTCGMALFGSSMYQLGKLKEKKVDLKRWKFLNDELDKQLKELLNKEEKEKKEGS